MAGLSSQTKMNRSREISLMATIVAMGAVARIVLGNIALGSPSPLFGILIKVGFTETLAIANGLALGPAAGFITGALIIVVSDLFMIPGAWTPFIAGIIGLLGFLAGVVRTRFRTLDSFKFAVVAAFLTVLSEFLQNLWVSLFYNIPISATMMTGLPSLITALANNVILLTAAGPKIVKLIQGAAGNASDRALIE
jgi:uncharacterized membrane protein